MLTLYPPIKPYAFHRLRVDDIHELYLEECGNPNGIPAVFLHGGPGGGITPADRRFFNPDTYRIILFDQRGAGQSTPHAELTNNTTDALVQDLEKIRQHLHIDKWVVFGGSWGSTLALVYSQTFPDRVLYLILRGIFLNRSEDIQWLFGGGGASKIFPEYWQEFLSILPKDFHHHPVEGYYELLNSDDEVNRLAAAKAWSTWEAHTCTLNPSETVLKHMQDPHTALGIARLECHYFLNNSFLAPNQIMDNISKIQHIPGIILHGRYDMNCALENAWVLHHAWPNASLEIIRNAGHASSEPGMTNGLILATQIAAESLGETT